MDNPSEKDTIWDQLRRVLEDTGGNGGAVNVLRRKVNNRTSAIDVILEEFFPISWRTVKGLTHVRDETFEYNNEEVKIEKNGAQLVIRSNDGRSHETLGNAIVEAFSTHVMIKNNFLASILGTPYTALESRGESVLSISDVLMQLKLHNKPTETRKEEEEEEEEEEDDDDDDDDNAEEEEEEEDDDDDDDAEEDEEEEDDDDDNAKEKLHTLTYNGTDFTLNVTDDDSYITIRSTDDTSSSEDLANELLTGLEKTYKGKLKIAQISRTCAITKCTELTYNWEWNKVSMKEVLGVIKGFGTKIPHSRAYKGAHDDLHDMFVQQQTPRGSLGPLGDVFAQL